MSTAITSDTTPIDAQAAFVAEMPRMASVIHHQTRRWAPSRRPEARADALAAAWAAWHGLARRGKDPRAVGPCGIARNAVRYVAAGRKLGCGATGRAAIDIYDHRARRRRGFALVSLEREADRGEADDAGDWREWLAEDRRCSPADEACFRIDFAAWLAGLPPRKRRIAEGLAAGRTTGEMARATGVTPGAISQARSWLEGSWRRFQGEFQSPSDGRPSPARPSGHPVPRFRTPNP
jgi:hypothetical protein